MLSDSNKLWYRNDNKAKMNTNELHRISIYFNEKSLILMCFNGQQQQVTDLEFNSHEILTKAVNYSVWAAVQDSTEIVINLRPPAPFISYEICNIGYMLCRILTSSPNGNSDLRLQFFGNLWIWPKLPSVAPTLTIALWILSFTSKVPRKTHQG